MGKGDVIKVNDLNLILRTLLCTWLVLFLSQSLHHKSITDSCKAKHINGLRVKTIGLLISFFFFKFPQSYLLLLESVQTLYGLFLEYITWDIQSPKPMRGNKRTKTGSCSLTTTQRKSYICSHMHLQTHTLTSTHIYTHMHKK